MTAVGRRAVEIPPPGPLQTMLARQIAAQAALPPEERAEALAYLQGSVMRYWATLRTLAHRLPADAAACRVLDLGSYPGHLTLLIRERFGCRLTGLTALTSPAFAETMARAGIPVHVHDVERAALPFPAGSFDVVLGLDLIEHLTFNVPFVLAEACRVLRSGGTLLLTTPNLASLWNRWRLLRGRPIGKPLEDEQHPFYGPPPSGDGPPPAWLAMRHIRELTPSELRGLLRRSGFPDPQVAGLRFPVRWSSAGLSPLGYVSSLGFQALAQLVPNVRTSLVAAAAKP